MNNNFEIQRLIFIYINIYNIIDLFIGLKITKLYIKQKEYIIHHILSLAIITYILNTTDKHLINVLFPEPVVPNTPNELPAGI